MFTYTGAAVCHSNTFGGRSDDGESSGLTIGLAEVVAIGAGVIREHWCVVVGVEVSNVGLGLEGNLFREGLAGVACSFDVGR
jgi:hypothetical protein